MKAIIAMDSFKGCLTSAEAGKAALKAFADGEAEVIPVSDGGEGFSTILTESLGGSFRAVSCHDPLGRSIKARYGIIGRTAIIETAAASGLGLLRKDELNPLLATSYGTGELISDALEYDCEEIWLGLGGSATCDGGTGMLQALGYRFLPDDSGSFVSGDVQRAAPREESVSRNIPNVILKDIHGIDIPERNKLLDSCKITGFYDVSAPFCGTGGAARMFAPQKGADPEMVESLDVWLTMLCEVYSKYSGKDVLNIPGAGAAGGIGGALGGVLGASMVQGIQKVLDISGLDSKLESCDIVITGEGRADAQTLRGKVPVGVLEYVRAHTVPVHRPKVILIAGQVSDRQQILNAGFDAVLQITPEGMPLSEALDPVTASANITQSMQSYLQQRCSGEKYSISHPTIHSRLLSGEKPVTIHPIFLKPHRS